MAAAVADGPGLLIGREMRRSDEASDPHGGDVPADRFAQGLPPAQRLTLASPVKLGELR
jgi:hypothetical protein